MKILVTGGAGFIGTNLVRKLVELGHEVVSLDDYTNGNAANENRKASYLSEDIEKISYFEGSEVDVVFHLAALSRIQPSFKYPAEYFRVNTKGTEAVCDWAAQYGVKVIYAGSSSVHTQPFNSPYATYKFLGEQICQMYRSCYNLDVHIARFYNVYGPCETETGEFASLIGKWRECIKNKVPLPIVGTGEQTRAFTHVEDIVDGLIKIMDYQEDKNNVWELGTSIVHSVNDVANLFKSKFNCESEFILDQPGNYKESYRANDLATELLDWKAKDRLQEYINGL